MISQTAKFCLSPNWLCHRSKQRGDRTALVFAGKSWTFAEIEAEARSISIGLASLGVTLGSRVAVLMSNHLNYVTLTHALTKLGSIEVLINIRLTAAEILWQLQDCDVKLLVHDLARSELARAIQICDPSINLLNLELGLELDPIKVSLSTFSESLREEIDLDAVQSIIYTSGTTGKPKGVQLTYGNHFHSAIASGLNLGIDGLDNWLICLPLYHVGGLSIVWRSAICGIRIAIHDRFDPASIIQSICTEQVTLISLVPTMLTRILNHESFSDALPYWQKLRCILLGGAAIDRALLAKCDRLQLPIAPTYGLTEAASQVTTLLPSQVQAKPGSVGLPLLCDRIKIVSIEDECVELPSGEVGQILVKGANVMLGYVNFPPVEIDRWLCTGDLGYLDADGFLYVVSRRSDLIVSGGENIYPAEVESVLALHPSIVKVSAEVCVIGIDDREWGQIVVAVIATDLSTAKELPSLQAIRIFCLEQHLASYKLPKALYKLDAFPKTGSGKIRRQAVRSILLDRKTSSPA